MLTYAQQILELTQWTGQTMAPSTVDNVIGRATIDYELKEAYQPSNVVLDMWFLGWRQLLQTGGGELIKLHADNAEEQRSERSHWGTEKLILFCFDGK